MEKKMQLVKVELILHFDSVISSGVRNREFQKCWYYQSLYIHKRSSIALTDLSIGPETIQQYTHLHLYQVFISGCHSRDVNSFTVKDSYQETTRFLKMINFAFKSSWHLEDQMLSSKILMFPRYMTYKHLRLWIRNLVDQFFPLM